MGLNLNQRLCGLLMVWEVVENGLDYVFLMIQTVVVSTLRCAEECEGSIVSDLCIKLVEIIFWTLVSMASYGL